MRTRRRGKPQGARRKRQGAEIGETERDGRASANVATRKLELFFEKGATSKSSSASS